MNISNINSPSDVSQLLPSQDMKALAASHMVTESTDLSPFVVMARLRRLRRSDPNPFKAVISRISSALLLGNTSFPQTAEVVGGASEADKTFVLATRTRRWPATLFGGVVLLAVAVLMLLGPAHHAAMPWVLGGGKAVAGTAAVVHTSEPGRESPAHTPPPPAALLPVVGALPVTKSLLSTAMSLPTEATKRSRQNTRRTASPPATKGWSSDERWLAH